MSEHLDYRYDESMLKDIIEQQCKTAEKAIIERIGADIFGAEDISPRMRRLLERGRAKLNQLEP